MRQSRTYGDWRRGPSAAGDPAAGEYNSENAQVYENGTLGPRPGWKEFTDTAGTRVFDPSADDPIGFTWFLQTDDEDYLAVIFDDAGTHKYDVLDLTNGDWEAGGSLSNLPDAPTLAGNLNPSTFDDQGKVPCWNDGSQQTSLGGYFSISDASSIGTPAAPNTSDGYPMAVTLYRERAYYWGFTAKPGRIYVSDAADYSTVGATSFFDVNADVDSYAGGIVGMWSIKNALLIATKDNRWLVLTGPNADNGTLRELGRDFVPILNSAVVVDNELYFLNPTAKGVAIATPSFVETTALEYMSPTAYPGSTSERPDLAFMPQAGVGDEVSRSLVLVGRALLDDPNLVAVERINDVFVLSRWDYDTATPEDVFLTRGRTGQMWALVREASDWVPYSRDFTLNRPGNSGDSRSVALTNEAGVTSGSEVVVDLAEIEASDGRIVRPVKVVLDIDYWKGGNYSAPELKVDATVLGTEGATPEDTLTQQVVTTTAWGNSTGNQPLRRRVPVVLPQGQLGTAFRIRITYDNLALDTVQVYYEDQEDPR